MFLLYHRKQNLASFALTTMAPFQDYRVDIQKLCKILCGIFVRNLTKVSEEDKFEKELVTKTYSPSAVWKYFVFHRDDTEKKHVACQHRFMSVGTISFNITNLLDADKFYLAVVRFR